MSKQLWDPGAPPGWEELAHRSAMDRAWEAYYGRADRPLAVDRWGHDDNVRLSFARLIVDAGVGFLVGRGLAVEAVMAPGAAEDAAALTEAQALLDRVWLANHKDLFLHRLAVAGAVCGQAFARISREAPQGAEEGLPRIIAPDPRAVWVRSAADDVERIDGYRVCWTEGDAARADRAWCLDPAGARWVERDMERPSGGGGWASRSVRAWPYPWPPLVACQNLPAPNAYWGVSDLEPDVLQLCGDLEKVMGSMARILRLHAFPRLWITGARRTDLDLEQDGILFLPSPDCSVGSLEMRGDLSASLSMFTRLKEALHEITRVPEATGSRMDGMGRLSGSALRILYRPLLDKTMTKRLLYGDLVRRVSLAALTVAADALAPGLPTGRLGVRLHWPDPLPEDDTPDAATT